MNVSEMFKNENPIGTKFLVELEVKERDGYGNIIACTTGSDIAKEFEKLTGVTINKVYKKDITADVTKDMETIVSELLTTIRELKSQGHNI